MNYYNLIIELYNKIIKIKINNNKNNNNDK